MFYFVYIRIVVCIIISKVVCIGKMKHDEKDWFCIIKSSEIMHIVSISVGVIMKYADDTVLMVDLEKKPQDPLDRVAEESNVTVFYFKSEETAFKPNILYR